MQQFIKHLLYALGIILGIRKIRMVVKIIVLYTHLKKKDKGPENFC